MTVTYSAVVCTYGRPDQLRSALEAIVACRPPASEVLVVDGDETRSAERVADSFPGVRYLPTERGLTRQRNYALDHAHGDVVAFFDDDARPAADVFAQLDHAYGDPGVVGATGRVIEPQSNPIGGQGSGWRRLLPGSGRPGHFSAAGYPRRFASLPASADIELMQGCFMTARRSVAIEVRFDEQLLGYGLAEDEDFSYRLSRRGRIRYLPDAVVHHDNTGFGTRDRYAFNRQVVQNRTYLFRKNFPQTVVARLQFRVLLVVLVVHRVVNRDWTGVRGLFRGMVDARRR